MRRIWTTAVGVLALGLVPNLARAADHLDGPAASMDPSVDITDVFAWMNGDASKAYLVMNVTRAADKAMSKFSNTVKYVIHTNSRGAFFADKAPKELTDIICTFSDGTGKSAECWVVDVKGAATLDYVKGDASATSGVASASGKIKVFAGPRNDPFFFNLDGFKNAATAVNGAAGKLTFDKNGCPALDMATQGALVGALQSDKAGMKPAKDNFSGLNVLSIVVAIDKTLLNKGGKTVAVWAATHK